MLKNRKWWLLIATVMTFLLIMTACAPANTATEAPPAVEEPVEEEPVEEPTVEEEEPTEEPPRRLRSRPRRPLRRPTRVRR